MALDRRNTLLARYCPDELGLETKTGIPFGGELEVDPPQL